MRNSEHPTDPAPPMEESTGANSLVGRLISGRYQIESELGVGGMGSVYQAEHTHMRKRVAIKVLHPEMTQLPEVVARFEREAMAAAHIEHPNVAAATDFGKLEDGSFFLVLEFVEGLSLRDALDEGAMSLDRVLLIGSQIASALVRAHALGIVHRDLKPDNVMLVERDGNTDFVKVLDFGIAKVPVAEIAKGEKQQALTRLGMVYGTPEYMAPEQALGQDVDARADLYALGVILYEMMTGSRPFDAENPVTLLGLQVTKEPPSFQERAPTLAIPSEVEALVMELLEKEATRRPSDAKQVLEALDYLRLGGVVRSPDGSVPNFNAARASVGSIPDAVLNVAAATNVQIRPPEASSPGNDGGSVVDTGSIRLSRSSSPALTAHLTSSLRAIQIAPRFRTARQMVDHLRRRLPPKMLDVPIYTYLLAAIATSALTTICGSLLVCWAMTPVKAEAYIGVTAVPALAESAAAKVSATAPPDELEAAKAEGPAALEELSDKYPGDTVPLKALVAVHEEKKHLSKAMRVYQRLLTLEPGLKNDEKVQTSVFRAALSSTSRNQAFELMEKHLGPSGPDMLYELAYGGKAKGTTRSVAKKSLSKKEVRANGSPALKIALEFISAKGCEGKHKLLKRVEKDGDGRMVPLLSRLRHGKGCGFLSLRDCYPCMRRDKALTNAYAAVKERQKSGK